VKNFQIIHEHEKEYIALQSGRVSDHIFNVDIRYPFTLFQGKEEHWLIIAFGIVLTSFDPKLSAD
jgi:tubby-related protein 1